MQTSEAGVKRAVRLGAADKRAASGSAVTVGTRWKREWGKNPTLAQVAAPSPVAPRGVFRAARGGGTAASHCQSRWGMNLVCRAWAHGQPLCCAASAGALAGLFFFCFRNCSLFNPPIISLTAAFSLTVVMFVCVHKNSRKRLCRCH